MSLIQRRGLTHVQVNRAKQHAPLCSFKMDASIRQDGLDLQIDAGLNSSAAWTEHFDARSVDSDNPVKGDEEWSPAAGIPARVLKNFQGDPAASEL